MDRSAYVVAAGSSSLDFYYEAAHWPALGDKAMVRALDVRVGGLISNAACVMAACGLPVYMVDLVEEAHRAQILEELHRYGVRTEFVTTAPGYRQSSTAIYLVDGEKTILVNKNKPPVAVSGAMASRIRGAAALYSIIPELRLLEGHEELVREMKRGGGRLVLDMETAAFSDTPEDRAIAARADILFFNEQGMDKFRGNETPAQAADRLLGQGVELVVVTLAQRGCRVHTREGTVSVDGLAVDVVDATGAGDAFNSVFLCGVLAGRPVAECARLANAAGARAVTLRGPKSGAADQQTLLRFLDDWNGR